MNVKIIKVLEEKQVQVLWEDERKESTFET